MTQPSLPLILPHPPAPPHGHAHLPAPISLVNEACQVAGKTKKIFRDQGGKIGEQEREALKQELGDVLWYLAQTGTGLRLSLEKLFSRLERRQMRGDGDQR